MSIGEKKIDIHGIGNTYGGIYALEYNGAYYWIIEDYDTDFENIDEWCEIPKSLFDELLSYKENW